MGSSRIRAGLSALVCSGAAMLALTGVAQASTYTNPTPITIESAETNDAASPYPSSINVQGLEGTVAISPGLTVTLHGLTHGWPEDIDILLVSPDPAGRGILMSDTCGTSAFPIVNQTFTFVENAASQLPAAGPCSTGTYLPTDRVPADAFPAPAPSPPSLGIGPGSAISGKNPNGVWSLYVMDDITSFGGTIAGGWTLSFTAGMGTRCASGFAPTITGTAGDDVIEGTPQTDIIAGYGGNDTIRGGGLEDYICGGAGKDSISGGAGSDGLSGEAGKDKLKGGAGSDTLKGGPGKDKLKGQGAIDILNGQGGKDTCSGGGGSDRVRSCETEK